MRKPPLLGFKLDKCLQERIIGMTSHAAPVNTNIVIGTGRATLLKHSKSSLEEFGGSIVLGKEWAMSVLRRS